MNNPSNGKLHCPNCKSHNISITTESSVNSAMTTHRGNRSSSIVSNSHRNFWVCGDCGIKFRNLQSLEEELQKSRKTPIVTLILSILLFIVSVSFIVMGMDNMFGLIVFLPLIITTGVTAIVFFIMTFVCKGKIKKMEQERNYLKQNCFN